MYLQVIIYLTVFLIFTSCDSVVSKKIHDDAVTRKQAEVIPKIYTYGLHDYEREHARSVVAKKYGFEYQMVAGCEVTQELVDSVEIHNNNVYELLTKKWGKNWRSVFDKEVEDVYAVERQITDIVKKQPLLVKKEIELNKNGKSLRFQVLPIAEKSFYSVKVYQVYIINGIIHQTLLHNMVFDYNSKTLDTIAKGQ